jgi:membrane protease YdiL (CAAX protease family)
MLASRPFSTWLDAGTAAEQPARQEQGMNYVRLIKSWLSRRRSLQAECNSQDAAGVPSPSANVAPGAAPASATDGRPLIHPPRSAASVWIETAIVLLLAVGPYLFHAVMWSTVAGGQTHFTFHYRWLGVLVQSLQIGAPVLYLIYRSGEPWSVFGFRRPRWLRDALGGTLLFICGYGLYYLLYPPVWRVWTALFAAPPVETTAADLSRFVPAGTGWSAWLLVLIAACCNGFVEELVMRAYLIPRFERLLGRAWLGVLCSAALFAAYHLYQGFPGVLSAAIIGLLYGALFCWIRRSGRSLWRMPSRT